MRSTIIAAAIALSASTVLAAPPTKLTHQDGSTTTVSGNSGGSKATGWYGGEGGVSTGKSQAGMVKEVKQAGKDKGNPVVKTERAK